MKPAKKPGENIIVRLKRDEKKKVLDWINNQSNISDAIRFLIELEITRNGIKDFQEFIPVKRSEAFLVEYLKKERMQEEYRQNDVTEPVFMHTASSIKEGSREIETQPSLSADSVDFNRKSVSLFPTDNKVDKDIGNSYTVITDSIERKEVVEEINTLTEEDTLELQKQEQRKKRLQKAQKVWNSI
jgi:hypothetical protein